MAGIVPSIHVGWALLMGFAVWRSTRSRPLGLLALLWPLLVAVAVVASGNHYYFDVITGVLAAVIGLWMGSLLLDWWERRRGLRPRWAALHLP